MLGLYEYQTSQTSPISSSDFDDFVEQDLAALKAQLAAGINVERSLPLPITPRGSVSVSGESVPHSLGRQRTQARSQSVAGFDNPSSVSPHEHEHEHHHEHEHSPALRSARLPSVPVTDQELRVIKRKLSRKLPPKLTESLENLASSQGSTHSHSPTASETADLPPVPDVPTTYILQTDQPLHQELPITTVLPARTGSKKAPRKALPPTPAPSYSMVSRRSTSLASSVSTNLLTPSSSIGAFPRHSLECSSGSASTCGTWSLVDEIELAERAARLRKDPKNETRKEKKERKQREKDEFDQSTPPSMKQLYEASELEVMGEDGKRVKFGDLVRSRRTIVIFIRHWFCPLCAQYIQSIISQVNPETLEHAGVNLIIIGNGSRKMLPSYKNKAFKCPFPIYTDPTLALYRAVGLTRQTGDAGPDSDAGDYLVQTPLESTLATIKRATQMPLRNPGHFLQLGGEFIFDSTLSVSYTHRMITTRSHSPIRDVCTAAGVRLEWVHYEPGPPPPPVHRQSIILEEVIEGDEGEERAVDWRMSRDSEVDRIKALKEARRMGARWSDARQPVRVVGEDEEAMVGHFGALGFAERA